MSIRQTILATLVVLGIVRGLADEGMYPISQIGKLDLASLGVQVSAKDLYNPGGVSLIDAIVNIGGCTGSFVSSDGLILTNHHCAFAAVQAASTTERDYVTHGFLARTKAEEIRALGNSVRITESYRDVSAEVLQAVSDTMGPAARTRAIVAVTKEIVARTEREHPGRRAEVAEMLAGRSYVLFVYTFLRDVRLVYVPPRAIGEFGGEDDNWVWPRHTGDFAFLRAYVAPDGSPAAYSAQNVPYRPRSVLRLQPAGAAEEDPVFILGFPGRTFRHRTSHFLAYEKEIRLPAAADLFAWQIETMQKAGEHDRSVALKFDARIKTLANTMKNYRGKLQGLERLSLVERKQEEEQKLQAFILADPVRRAKYGTLLEDLAGLYEEMRSVAPYEFVMDNMRTASTRLSSALMVVEGSRELQKPDLQRETPYMIRNLDRTKQSIETGFGNYHEPTDCRMLQEILERASRLPAPLRVEALEAVVGGDSPTQSIRAFLEQAYTNTMLTSADTVLALMHMTPDSVSGIDDSFLDLARRLEPAYRRLREDRQAREGRLTRLTADLVEVKHQFMPATFIPDANSTLRFTSGRVRGYSPADATYYRPFTTLTGVLEKTTGKDPFVTPAVVRDLYRARKFGRYASPALGTVPVALLYNLDTTGGNSGSPLLNARGEIVGVNFDRTFEATINDYAWSEEYSRSIAVDVRYVLWVTEAVGGASFLLREMGVEPSITN